jgi:hypothetical protein
MANKKAGLMPKIFSTYLASSNASPKVGASGIPAKLKILVVIPETFFSTSAFSPSCF